jgi:hypothetical protein
MSVSIYGRLAPFPSTGRMRYEYKKTDLFDRSEDVEYKA